VVVPPLQDGGTFKKWAIGVGPVSSVEHLLRKDEALSSNCSTAKKKKWNPVGVFT
jgi:hypothetical protein